MKLWKASFNVLPVAVLLPLLVGAPTSASAQEAYQIGLTGDLSGPSSGTYKPLAEGIRVYFDLVNAKGGINGHPVQLVTRDSASDASRVVADLNEFDSLGTLATVLVSPSGTIGAYAQRSKQVRMPTLYTNACYPPATPPSPNEEFFCPGISTLAEALSAVDLMIELMGKPDFKLAFVTTDIPGARGAAEKLMKPYAEKRGVTVVDVAVMPVASSDASTIARSLVDRGTEAVISYTISKHMLAGADALAQLGWKGKYLLSSELPGVFAQFEQLKNGNIYGFDQLSLLSEGKPVHEDIKQAAAKFGFDYNLADIRFGYRNGMVLGAALEACGWPCDREKLLQAMNGLNVDSQDMVDLNGGPVTWSATNHTSPGKKLRVYHWDPAKGEIATAIDWYTVEEKDWK